MATPKKESRKFRSYFRGVKAEMKKVIWPSKGDLLSYTGAVVFISILVSLVVWILDYVIRFALSFVI